MRKSVPVAALASAVAGWKGTAVVVQRNPDRGELQEFAAASRLALHDASDLNEDLVALHALLSVLDDYAGVSSTSMHLRAAAGRTARVLIAFPPEWRWLAAGPKSPWFPGFSLYREEETPGWEPALARLQRDLADR
ncbi:MAG: hypothetical protein IT529_09725 [Burkholderiales bacterium]|nr:hypothetical protein [Burkholderiales bacterium]